MKKEELIQKWFAEFQEDEVETLSAFYNRVRCEAQDNGMIMAADFDDLKVNINIEGVTIEDFETFFERVLLPAPGIEESNAGNMKKESIFIKRHGGKRSGAGRKSKEDKEKVIPCTIYVKPAHFDSFKLHASDAAADMNAGRNVKAETVWQTLNAVVMFLEKGHTVSTEDIRKVLQQNRPAIGTYSPGE